MPLLSLRKITWLAAFAVFSCLSVYAQIGNEWIYFNQPYWKIPVAADGIYRLDYSTLVAAGFPDGADPDKIQLFHRGVEQALFIQDGNDKSFDPGDFVEFFGRGNDGESDTELYVSPSAQPHTYYNLFTDTTYYFLTVGPGNGKRMDRIAPDEPGAATPFYWQEELTVLAESYSAGQNYGDILLSAFDLGEGWMGKQIIQNQSATYTIEGITQRFTGVGPELEVLLVGRGPMNHQVELYANGRLLGTANFAGFDKHLFRQTLTWSDIPAVKLDVMVKVVGSPDRASVAYVRLRYPRMWDMEAAAEKFFIPSEQTNPLRVEINNAPSATRLFDVTDVNSPARISVSQTEPLTAVIPSSVRQIYASAQYRTPPVERASFRQIDPTAQNFVIITHSALRKPAMGYTDPVKAYGEYRALPMGGGYDTLIINVDQLFDQFNYGEKSPRAIYRFVKFLATGKLPAYLFIVGKGLDVNYGYYRNPGLFTQYRDLVPVAGYPGSDQLYSAGLLSNPHAPSVATGRLSASTPQDVAAYLNKVKEFEAMAFNDLRKKNVLHLSGGIFEGEPQRFKGYLQGFAEIAESHYLGGKVTAIAKQTTDVAVVHVADEVNAGVNLITFFGHSAPTTTDFDIGNVTDPAMGYHNQGNYPLLFMNGCSSGSIFLNTTTFGENWTNAPDRGAIGVIAHSALGFESRLRQYANLFYEIGLGDSTFINRGIGVIQKEIAQRYLNTYGNSPGSITQVQQMVLMADPAIRLFGAEKPDYAVEEGLASLTSFDGGGITAQTDSFKLNVIVRNFGLSIPGTFKVVVERTLPDQSIYTYESTVANVRYADTLTLVIPRVSGAYGNNTFTVRVDADNAVDELNENNNAVSFGYFLPLSGTRNLYPPNYAIVTTPDLRLTFQHTDLLAGHSDYVLELDTTNTFNSPAMQSFFIASGVLVQQNVRLAGADTLAWYWRTKRLDPEGNDSIVWTMSTFTYIPGGKEGWAQLHFPQFANNRLEGLVADPQMRSFDYEETRATLFVRTFGPDLGYPPDSVDFQINGTEYNIYTDFGCRNNTINFVAFDKKTAHPYPGIYMTWQDINLLFGGRRLICGREPYVINSFRPDELVMGNGGDLIQYIDNIPAGDSVVIFNLGDAGYSQWPMEAVNKLNELGISPAQISALIDGEPVVILARKGAPTGTAKLMTTDAAPTTDQPLSFQGTVTGRMSSGVMETPIIGPATAWGNFFLRVSETDPSDEWSFHIVGITDSGEEETVMPNVTSDADLSMIDATEFPFIKVLFESSDETLVSAPKLDLWIVTYEPVPEGVALFDGDNKLEIVAEGQEWVGAFQFVNITERPFEDSVAVVFSVNNPSTFAVTQGTMNIKGPGARDTTAFIVRFPTIGHAGFNNVGIQANPHLYHELDYNNNIIVLNNKIEVVPDREPPVLDVTIDGRYHMNGDHVPPSPEIRIRLWDDNPWLPIDTTRVNILLAWPCDEAICPFERINFSRPDVQWSSESVDNVFEVVFRPTGLPEGRYVINVEAKDRSGNSSGVEPYEVSFYVEHETSLSISSIYPNPSKGLAALDISLTGDAKPWYVGVRFVNITGETVLSTALPTDDLHIGTNRVRWTVSDERGNTLPPGIYFYRVTVLVGNSKYVSEGRMIVAE